MKSDRFFSFLSKNSPIHPRMGVCAPLMRHARGMQGLVVGRQNPVLKAFGNEAGPDRVATIGLSNELTASHPDGWALIPYGIYPNERGLQRFAREDAERMVSYFKSAWNTVKRALTGMPIYSGHPDMADTVAKERDREKDPAKRARLAALVNEIERRWPDRTVYGTIIDLEARADGLALRLVLTEAGVGLVNEQGQKFFSPHWLGMPLDTTGGGPEHACIYLCSIGLTDRPNIAGTSLVNSAQSRAAENNPQQKQTMNPFIIALLAALGRPLANTATEQEITEALKAAVPVATGLLARPEATALVNEQTARTTAETKISELTTALANERTALSAALEAHATTLVNHAVTGGRITEAEKSVWLGRLKRDFAGESVALANTQPVVKTSARTEGLGARKVSSAAGDQFTALVNEAMPQHGNNWSAAWNAVKATAAGKALFAQMETADAARAATS